MHLEELVATVLAAPARLPGSRLVCIDGRAGAGKTSLSADLALACSATSPVTSPVTTVHMDDVYEGWSGLPAAADQVFHQLIEPWMAGRAGTLAAWEWRAHRRLGAVPVEPAPLILLEGVGSWSRRYADAVSTLVWLECEEQTRRLRALERDGGVFDAHWDSWAADERLVHVREQTPMHADVVIDTTVQRAVSLP